MPSVAENLTRIRGAIGEAAAGAGRPAESIKLLAVSKTHPADAVRQAMEAGQISFGESKVQEALPKMDTLPSHLEWHFICHLQANKVRKAVGRFALFHSVDDLELARRISRVSSELGTTTRLLVEVNVSGEASKFGLSPENLEPAVESMLSLPGIRIEGLMTMAPYNADPEASRPFFARLRGLGEALRSATGEPLPELSMGMSGDFLPAIEEGATIVRVGSSIFGERSA
jgi:PLP dependent protein